MVSAQNVKYVNPFIGTDGTGHTFPGASLPFGMVQPGPDCKDSNWDYTSGYQFADKTILGFSQTHLSGTGIGELGDILLLPFSGDDDLKNILLKDTEQASAGYYTVTKGDGVKVELTCSGRVAFHRYTFPSSDAKVMVDFQHGIRFLTDSLVLESDIKIEDSKTISGYCRTKNWVERKYYFTLTFDSPFMKYVQLDKAPKTNAPKYILNFDLQASNVLQAKIALSTVDVQGAKSNLQNELSHWDFDKTKEMAQSVWSEYLDRIEVEGSEQQKVLFYTAMYHLLLQPSNIADTDGKYRGADGKVAHVKNGAYYSTLSNWDIYRAAFPLLQIIAPEHIDDIVNSMIAHHQAVGFLPIWTVWGQDNYCMIGNHAIPMIVSAYQNGFKKFDAKQALKAIIETSTRPHIHSEWNVYNKYGYFPFDIIKDEAVSKTLENGYDDWCVAFMANKLGEKRINQQFLKRSKYYRNLYDNESKLLRGKDSKGNWRTPFDPTKATSPMNNPGDYTEANAWQYFWTPAQHDVEGIIELLGGKDAFTAHLDEFFTTQMPHPDKHLGQEAVIGQYAHGNEPCHHIAYLYAYSDKPWMGQHYINKIISEFYKPTPDGMLGNDDCGQMSAWYIFSAMGFYPVNPATGEFVLGVPQFHKIVIKQPNNKQFTIMAENLSKKNVYAKHATLNNQEVSGHITFNQIVGGGTLKFEMQPAPLDSRSYTSLKFGSIKPTGWLKEQMQGDLDGILSKLDSLVPDLMNDPIYSTGRLTLGSKAKELGNNRHADAPGDEQYKWWNSETQSNWRDGYARTALLLEDEVQIEKIKKYIYEMLATQDEDGYLGIYTPKLRYNFNKENGELWAKTTLFRVLLGYYEATGDTVVWNALVRGVDNVMRNWKINESQPFAAGNEFNGGATHGLTFVDVLERMAQLTGDEQYRAYALFLYHDFSHHYASEYDAQLNNALDVQKPLMCHGVHSYEHLRPLIVATYTEKSDSLMQALENYLSKIKQATTVTGGAIGDEWINGRVADATNTGYEYCSLHELLDSYSLLIQKYGMERYAEQIENIFYNAAQGARHPSKVGIAYLKTDNSYKMVGEGNFKDEHNSAQTRYKYSPVHQDVAVCCVPNAMRISPYFIQNAWMKDADGSLTAHLLMPSSVRTEIDGELVKIDMETEYPNKLYFNLKLSASNPISTKLKIRRPEWVTEVVCSASYVESNGYIVFDLNNVSTLEVKIEFKTTVRTIKDSNGENYFAYGAQIYALPIEAKEIKGREYAPGYADYMYEPLDKTQYHFTPNHNAKYSNGRIIVNLINNVTLKEEVVELIPIKETILRQAAFIQL